LLFLKQQQNVNLERLNSVPAKINYSEIHNRVLDVIREEFNSLFVFSITLHKCRKRFLILFLRRGSFELGAGCYLTRSDIWINVAIIWWCCCCFSLFLSFRGALSHFFHSLCAIYAETIVQLNWFLVYFVVEWDNFTGNCVALAIETWVIEQKFWNLSSGNIS
jgi:hypothetical protein